MPLYEYKCHTCGKTFEVLQRFSDTPLTTHAECGGEVEKLVSAPAFHLKGTGWYATDYAKNSGSASKTEDHKSDSHKNDSDKDKSDKGDARKSDSTTESTATPSGTSAGSATESKTTTSESKPAAPSQSTVSSEK